MNQTARDPEIDLGELFLKKNKKKNIYNKPMEI